MSAPASDYQRAVELLRSGWSVASTARLLKRADSTVRSWRKRAGITPRPAGRPAMDADAGPLGRYSYRAPEAYQRRALKMLRELGLENVAQLIRAMGRGEASIVRTASSPVDDGPTVPVVARVCWPYGGGKEDEAEIAISASYQGDLLDHPEVKEALDELVFDRVDMFAEVKADG